jgi:hypothetical protein
MHILIHKQTNKQTNSVAFSSQANYTYDNFIHFRESIGDAGWITVLHGYKKAKNISDECRLL